MNPNAKIDIVGNRHSLLIISMAAVWLACLVFFIQRLAQALSSGKVTPWWVNAAGLVAITILYFWYRQARDSRSSIAAHGVALVATCALLVPIAYGMTSSIWWLGLVGFAMVLLGRRHEALVWGIVIPIVVGVSVVLEPFVQIPGAAGEINIEAALAKITFVVILLGMSAGFRYVAEQRAVALLQSENRLAKANIELEQHRIHLEELVKERIADVQRTLEEKAALQSKLQKSQKMESLGLLAGGVAHDLNNVLSGIVSYPELLLIDMPEDSKFYRPLKAIMESGNRAAAIVQDLLTIARGVAMVKEPLALNQVISDYFQSPEFTRIKQLHPQVQFNTQLAHDLLTIMGSDVHIRKVLMNLISNAAESIKGKGMVKVTTENRFLDRPLESDVKIEEGEYCVLSICDSGQGINREDLARIFEPFYSKKKMGSSGTGLGLAVVWNILQDHKGHIHVTSNGNGSKFELYFPSTRETLESSEPDSRIANFCGQGESILVVDDNELQRDISCKMLKRLGYKSRATSSGEEAIEYLKTHPVDLILLDMIMDPGMGGYETYKAITEINPDQKVIILSGFAETKEVKKTQALGAGEFLKKPIMLEDLGLAVKRALSFEGC